MSNVKPAELVTIATFSYPTEAWIPKTRLEAEGIWSFVADADTVMMNWLYSNAIGGVKLQVRAEDVDRAVEILHSEPPDITADVAAYFEEEAVLCPVCQSAEVRFEKYAMRLVYLSWLLLRFPLPFLKQRWLCQSCGHTWKAGEDGC